MAVRCHPSERFNDADGVGGGRHARGGTETALATVAALGSLGKPLLTLPLDPQHRQITGIGIPGFPSYTCHRRYIDLIYFGLRNCAHYRGPPLLHCFHLVATSKLSFMANRHPYTKVAPIVMRLK
jgi:hypothetical protein